MRMPPDQLVGNFPNDVVDVESPGFARDFSMHYGQEQEIAEFLPKMCVIVASSGLDQFVGLFNCCRHQRFVGLFTVPRTTARRAQLGDDLAEIRKALS